MQGLDGLQRIPLHALERAPGRPDLRLAVEPQRGHLVHQDLLHAGERLEALLAVERALLEGQETIVLVVLPEGAVVALGTPERRAEVLDGAVDVAVDGTPAEQHRLHLALVDRLRGELRERAPFQIGHPHGDADLLEVPLDRFHHLAREQVATRRVVQREADVGRPGVLQQLLGPLRVVAERVVLVGVAVAADRAGRVQGLGGAREDALHDRLAVDRQVDRLTHALVLERVTLGVEVDPDDARRGWRGDGEAAVLGQPGRLLWRDVEDEVDVAALQREHPRALIGVGAADDGAQLRLAAPVLIVGLQPHFLAALVVDELEGAGADRRGVQVVVADLLDLRRAVHHDPVVAERVDERRERRLGRDLQVVLARHLHRLDHRQRGLADRVLAEALEIEPQRLGVERRAVGELDALARVQRPRLAVPGLLPRLHQPRDDLAVAGEPHQGLGNLIEDAAVVQAGGLVRVEDRHVGRHADDERVLRRRRGADHGDDHDRRQRHHQPAHPLAHRAPRATGRAHRWER